MPVLRVMLVNCGAGGSGVGGGLPDEGGPSSPPPPPPPQLAMALASTASAATHHSGVLRRVISLVAISDPDPGLPRLTPLVGSHRRAVERLGLDLLVGRVRHKGFGQPLAVC